MTLRMQSIKEMRDKFMEEKDHISHDHGNTSSSDVKKVIDFYKQGDKHEESNNYGNLGNAYYKLGDLKKATEYYNLHLQIAKEEGDERGESHAYCNLGNAYGSLGDFKKAIEYQNLHLQIAKKVGDKHGEGDAYNNLGVAYRSLGDFKKAIVTLTYILK